MTPVSFTAPPCRLMAVTPPSKEEKNLSNRRALEQLLDEREIEAVLVKYSHLLWTSTTGRTDEVFVANAHGNLSWHRRLRQPRCHPHAGRALEVFGRTQHLLGDYRIALDGDRATAKCDRRPSMCAGSAGRRPAHRLGRVPGPAGTAARGLAHRPSGTGSLFICPATWAASPLAVNQTIPNVGRRTERDSRTRPS